jgi:hypothetical protein
MLIFRLKNETWYKVLRNVDAYTKLNFRIVYNANYHL